MLGDIKHVTETVVIATHDMQLVCEWAERVVVLSEGTVLADGGRDEIFGDKAVVERAGIRPPAIFSMSRALDARALCYTVDEFVRKFSEV
jgi:energy-coupling factor transport system ATP-binding protein